jgi:hypothetical protein
MMVQVLSEVRQPQKTLKWAAPVASLVVTCLYILANIAYVSYHLHSTVHSRRIGMTNYRDALVCSLDERGDCRLGSYGGCDFLLKRKTRIGSAIFTSAKDTGVRSGRFCVPNPPRHHLPIHSWKLVFTDILQLTRYLSNAILPYSALMRTNTCVSSEAGVS